ncbi:MAG TPA: CDP-alcohol phosphatidyltransferase family protein, partial [Bacteroidota bacterium]|nr:CDP-alcohol phosphatidyltransferase family protein [Bacteroidota bacterium]
MLIDEYKRSLKMPEAEEVFDLLLYRPVAFLFVKAVYCSPITPNQVTFLSMVAGLVAAWFFSTGSAAFFYWAALFYAVANILDCSDGQLARLQNSGTLMGRVVDGVADYISSVAIFLSLGIGFARNADPQWLLVIGAGLSSALHAFFFDHYQSEFMSIVRSEKNFLEKEIEQFTQEIHRLENEKV